MRRVASYLLAFLITVLPTAVFAVELTNPLGYTSLTEFLRRLLQVVIMIGYPIIVLFIVYIGFLYIQAQGNADKLKKVHSYFLWALVGALLILGAQVLALAIQGTVEQLGAGV